MNAGCYGGETWNIVEAVTTVDRAGVLHRRTPADYSIGYRTVVMRSSNSPGTHQTLQSYGAGGEWFVSAVLALPRGDGENGRQKIKELLARRIASQPLGEPNAGSVFRNPRGTYAARLIEECALKGKAIGGAVISPKHANFIVNTGKASAADIEALIELAQNKVREKFGIELEREVRIVGARQRAGERGQQQRTDRSMQ
jgi:UDP-N-acetylmuramate dehydrogenase